MYVYIYITLHFYVVCFYVYGCVILYIFRRCAIVARKPAALVACRPNRSGRVFVSKFKIYNKILYIYVYVYTYIYIYILAL